MSAKSIVDRIQSALRSDQPDALPAAAAIAETHIKAMRRIARKPPKHPGSSYQIDASGNYDPHMYDLGNLMVEVRERLKRRKAKR